jgi:hypothetical protein
MLREVLAAAFLVFASGAAAQELYPLPPQPAGLAWPTQEWETAPLPADVDQATLDLAVTEAFAGVHPLMGETRAVLVVQGGRIVFERYNDGYSRDTRLISWSMAKSVTQAFVGAAASGTERACCPKAGWILPARQGPHRTPTFTARIGG